MPDENHKNIIEWNDKGQPISKVFDDIYFSTDHGLNESRYVFLDNNRLPARWLDKAKNQLERFTIFETGFGSGLNFLSTWQAWLSCKNNRKYKNLHFISVEKYPLSLQDLKKISALWPELKPLSDQLIDQYPPQPAKGLHRLTFNDRSIKLSLYFGDVLAGLEELYLSGFEQDNNEEMTGFGTSSYAVDAWYLDGFAPAKNPEMWTGDLFKHMTALSQESSLSSFSTFTAASSVRKNLIKHGFNCEKISGFGRKREMLCGYFTKPDKALATTSAEPTQKIQKHKRSSNAKDDQKISWLLQSQKKESCLDAIIIGGGLAGCHSAYALANRGLRVTIIEKESALAQHASGNTQGLVYTRLSPHSDPLSEFNTRAQIFSDQFYRKNNLYQKCGDATGIFHSAHNLKLNEYYKAISNYYALDDTQNCDFTNHKNNLFAQWIDKKNTEKTCGVPLAFGGLFVKESGWLNPPKLCKELSDHPNITVIKNIEIIHVEKKHSQNKNNSGGMDTWECFDKDKRLIASSKFVIIANAIDAKKITQSSHLPTKSIRGQVSYLAENTLSSKLKVPVCGEGYIAPAMPNDMGANFHSLGASFNLFDDSLTMTPSDQNDNFEKLFKTIPSLKNVETKLESEKLKGRVSFRTTSPDYFPIVGPLPHAENTLSTFSALRKNAKAIVKEPGQYYEGLYCHLALGSRGLAYAPLCAELLADLVTGDFLALEKSIYKHINPSRFLIRSLQKCKN